MTADATPLNAVHTRFKARPALMRAAGFFACALLLNGCGSVGAGVGFSVPILPGVSIGVGLGSGGPSVGVTAGSGPVGVGVGVNQRGQVTGGVGVGVGTEIGNSGVNAGVGVGAGRVLYDPDAPEPREPRRP